MNEKAVLFSVTIIISGLYITTVYPANLSGFIISFIPFIAGIIIAIKETKPLWLIIAGEILVINNPSMISSFLIQVMLGIIFFIFYISDDIRTLGVLSTGYLIIVAIFAVLAMNIQIAGYIILCVAILITGYLFQEMYRRNANRITAEDI